MIRWLQRLVNGYIASGDHPGIKAAVEHANLKPLTAYDVQVQLCEFKRAKRPGGLHGRVASGRKRLREE